MVTVQPLGLLDLERAHAGWNAWGRPDEAGPARDELGDWLMVELDGRLAGLGLVRHVWQELSGTWVHLHQGAVDPALRGLGVGTALVRASEQVCRQRAAEAGHLPRWELAANTAADDPSSAELLTAEGYGVAFTYLDLAREQPEPPSPLQLPPGYRLRPLEPDHRDRVYACMEAAYRGRRYRSAAPGGTEPGPELVLRRGPRPRGGGLGRG